MQAAPSFLATASPCGMRRPAITTFAPNIRSRFAAMTRRYRDPRTVGPQLRFLLYAWPYFGSADRAQVAYGEVGRRIPAGLAGNISTVAVLWHRVRRVLHLVVDACPVVAFADPSGRILHALYSGRALCRRVRRLPDRDRNGAGWRHTRRHPQFQQRLR